jgi:hypothetical protein
MLRKGLYLLVICASYFREAVEACIPRMKWVTAIAWFAGAACALNFGSDLLTATVPRGVTESVISGSRSNAVGIVFEDTGCMYEREPAKSGSRIWPTLITLRFGIHDEVGTRGDYGMFGFALDPEFRVKGCICVLYGYTDGPRGLENKRAQ